MRNNVIVHNRETAERMLSFYGLDSEYDSDMDVLPIEETLIMIRRSIDRKKKIESNRLRAYSNYK
jgi:hypothetical protein